MKEHQMSIKMRAEPGSLRCEMETWRDSRKIVRWTYSDMRRSGVDKITARRWIYRMVCASAPAITVINRYGN